MDRKEILERVLAEAEKRVLADPSAQNQAAWDRAVRMMADYSASREVNAPAFKNRLEVVRYLQDQGYKAKKSKLYKDCELGLLKVQPDGTILEASVAKYIANPRSGLIKGAPPLPPSDDEDVLKRKALADCVLTEAKARELKWKEELRKKEWIRWNRVTQVLTNRLDILRTGLESLCDLHMADYRAAGSLEEASEMFLRHLERLLNDYGNRASFISELREIR